MIKLNSINQKACLINWNHETYNIKPLFTFTYLAEATYSAVRLYIFLSVPGNWTHNLLRC